MKRLLSLSALAALLLLLAVPAFAVDPGEMLKDPKLEARAEKLGAGLRCMVCQSESIENSSADLARDLRIIVRERITAGDSDDTIVSYLVSRYGDYVLLNPPFKAKTLVLWLGPFGFLVVAIGAAFAFYRRRTKAPVPAAGLSPEEQRRLDALLKDSASK